MWWRIELQYKEKNSPIYPNLSKVLNNICELNQLEIDNTIMLSYTEGNFNKTAMCNLEGENEDYLRNNYYHFWKIKY